MGSFQNLFPTPTVEIHLPEVMLNLVIAAILGYILSRVYIRYGTSLSNRRLFASNFLLLICATTLVITVVKSSLALSLGLVGALSIVRFRAAIKEPEELAYLFLAIAAGLGLGANQMLLTLASFAVILSLIVLRSLRRKAPTFENLFLTISSGNPSVVPLDRIVAVLEKGCSSADLRRFDERPDGLEAAFLVGFDGFEQLDGIRKELRNLSESIHISFVDSRGIV